MKEKPVRNVEKFIGLAAGLTLLVGFLSLIGTVMAFLSSDTLAASLSLIAAGLAFGLFLMAVLGG
jgi:hypothetical protein